MRVVRCDDARCEALNRRILDMPRRHRVRRVDMSAMRSVNTARSHRMTARSSKVGA